MADRLPFSKDVLELFRKVEDAATPEDRRDSMIALGALFASEHEDSDESATDDYHRYFEEHARAMRDYERADLALEQATVRVGRLATQTIRTYLKECPQEDEGDLQEPRFN